MNNQEQDPDEITVVTFNYTLESNQEVVPRDVKCIQILSSVTEIADHAFADCSELEEIRFIHDPSEDTEGISSADGGGAGSEQQQQQQQKQQQQQQQQKMSRLQRIGHCAFLNCVSLSEIDIPNTVQLIGNAAFQGCTSLRFSQLPKELTELGVGAFLCCSSLTNIRLPNSLVRIGPSTWTRCSQLQTGELSVALEGIPFGTFESCSSLQSIVIPPAVKTIASNAFSDCYALLQVHLSEGLRGINAYAFRHCKSLWTIRIPSTVLKIGRAAFSECSALHTVEFANGNLQVLNALVFADCKNLFHLALPNSIHTHYPNTFSRCTFMTTLAGSSMKNRFDELPVHKLCYLQVHQPLSEALEAIQAFDKDLFDTHLEFRGMMTPFHLLAASSRPDPLLFEALMPKYPEHLWHKRDASRTTAMTYLLGNQAPESSAAIKHIMNSVLHDRIDSLGLNEWRIHVQAMIHATALAAVSNRKQLFDQTIQTFRRMEQKENLSNIELAVWKMEIAKMTFDNTTGDDDSNNGTCMLRESCRISCGAEIVIPNVLSYMEFENFIAVFGQ